MGGRQSGKDARGTIGEQIFAQVEQLTAGGAMNRLAAFNVVGERSGRKVGTVAANYYRVARKRGAPVRARRARGGGSGKIAAALRALQAALQDQERELARLRDENRRFQQLRRLLTV